MAVWWEPIRTFLHQAGAVSVVSFVLVFPDVIFRHAHRKPIEEALDAMTSKAKILWRAYFVVLTLTTWMLSVPIFRRLRAMRQS